MTDNSNKWRNATAASNSSIRDVVHIIDREALRAAFIIDTSDSLMGVVTDGDVRRAILRNVSFDSCVSNIMQTKPITCSPNHSSLTIKRMMEQNKLLHMPIVDNGRLVDVILMDDFQTTTSLDNPVFIMAGGFGTRLRPLTDNCPKPMLEIGGKPILESIIERFIEFGFHKFYISLHYKSDMITSYFRDGKSLGISIEYVREENPLGTAGALGLLPDNTSTLPMIVINGDILTQVDFRKLLEYHQSKKFIATMCVRQYEYQVPYGVIETDGTTITSIEEKPSYNFFVNSGIYVLEQDLLKTVTKHQSLDMPELLDSQMKLGKSVGMYPLHEYWLDIGKMQDFERAQSEYLNVFSSK